MKVFVKFWISYFPLIFASGLNGEATDDLKVHGHAYISKQVTSVEAEH